MVEMMSVIVRGVHGGIAGPPFCISVCVLTCFCWGFCLSGTLHQIHPGSESLTKHNVSFTLKWVLINFKRLLGKPRYFEYFSGTFRQEGLGNSHPYWIVCTALQSCTSELKLSDFNSYMYKSILLIFLHVLL